MFLTHRSEVGKVPCAAGHRTLDTLLAWLLLSKQELPGLLLTLPQCHSSPTHRVVAVSVAPSDPHRSARVHVLTS